MKNDKCIFIIYFFLNLMTLVSIFNFSRSFLQEFSIPFHCIFFTNMVISCYLFVVIRNDPGIVRRPLIPHDSLTIVNTASNIMENTFMTAVDDEYTKLADSFKSYCNVCNVDIVILK
jgi:hypothetical protein